MTAVTNLDTSGRTLAELEPIIERGLTAFLEVGQALTEIRDRRLYRETHSTFEAYLAGRWNLSRPRAYQLITAARVASTVVDVGSPAPTSERVARELAPLQNDPEAVREAWAEVVEEHGTEPTAAEVRERVRQRSDPRPPDLSERERQDRLADRALAQLRNWRADYGHLPHFRALIPTVDALLLDGPTAGAGRGRKRDPDMEVLIGKVNTTMRDLVFQLSPGAKVTDLVAALEYWLTKLREGGAA